MQFMTSCEKPTGGQSHLFKCWILPRINKKYATLVNGQGRFNFYSVLHHGKLALIPQEHHVRNVSSFTQRKMGMENTPSLNVKGVFNNDSFTSNGADSFCPYTHNSISEYWLPH